MRSRAIRLIEVVDSHTEGNPTRVVIGGVPVPPGATVLERQLYLCEHDDRLRTLLNFEPRGNPMMCSVLLMPPIDPAATFSVLLMEQDEYVPMCGHCIIGAATTVLAAGLLEITGDTTGVAFETLAGLVHCDVDTRGGNVGAVTLRNVASFLLHRDAQVEVPDLGQILVDVAFGGDFYAIVDADVLGFVVGPEHEKTLGSWSQAIVGAVNDQLTICHPVTSTIDRLYEVLWTTESSAVDVYRHAVVSPPATFDRSPCGTGSSARLAALWARGVVPVGRTVQFEGVLGTRFRAVATELTDVGGMPAILPQVTGRAYVTARSTIMLDPDDPFPGGYRLEHRPLSTSNEENHP